MTRHVPTLLLCAAGLLVAVAADAGSLYDERSYTGLTTDLTAREVGDGLAVLIYEDATAAASAGAETETEGDAGAELRDSSNSVSAGVGFSNEFSGDAVINRSGKLVARVSVTVERVFPNGELLIAGTQIIRFNQETQSIKVSGRVRPEDISAANTVLSTRLADATIEYTGEGLLEDAEKPGWLTRMLTRIF